MSHIGAAIGAVAGIAWGARAIWAMRQRNNEAQEADGKEIDRILSGKAADAEWLEEIRTEAKRGVVSPTTVKAVAQEAKMSDADIEAAEHSWTVWGGDEHGPFGTGSSSIMVGVTCAATCAAGILGGLSSGWAAGAWAAGLAAISCGDYRWRRIGMVDIVTTLGLGLLSAPSVAALGIQTATAFGCAAVLYGLALAGRAVCGREVFGLGDVLLIAAIAASAPFSLIRLERTLLALAAECLVALLGLKLTKSDSTVPFAPFLFLPALIYAFGA